MARSPEQIAIDRLFKKICRKAGTTMRDHAMVASGDHVLVGLSGGKDSMILLQVLKERIAALPFPVRLSAAHVAADSLGYRIDRKGLEDFCASLDVPLHIRQIAPDLDKASSDPDKGSSELDPDSSKLNKNHSELDHDSSKPNKASSDLNHDSSKLNKDHSELDHDSSKPNKASSDLNHDSSKLNKASSDLNHDSSKLNKASSDLNKAPAKKACFICSWHRRKALFELGKELGSNILALGHHRNDAVETVLLNMIYHGSVSSLPYKLRMFDGRVHLIRPLLDLDERLLEEYASIAGIVRIEKQCPHEDLTRRNSMRVLMKEIEKLHGQGPFNMFKSMSRVFPEYLPGCRDERPQEGQEGDCEGEGTGEGRREGTGEGDGQGRRE